MSGNLSTAIQSAISGRDLAQKSLSNCAQNIAMANKEGHSRTEQIYSSRVIGGVASGVQMKELVRLTDTVKVEQIRTTSSSLKYLETLTGIYNDLTLQIGAPGKDNTISASINNFKKSLEVLANTPEDASRRASVVRMAQALANDIKRLSDTTQEHRTAADTQIYNAVQDVNIILKNIEAINNEIQYSSTRGNPSTELLDQRDEALRSLSELMDVRAQINSLGIVSIFCNGGGTLLQGTAHQISFSQTSAIDATISYGAGTVNGLLIDGDPTRDITTNITEGRIGALLQARDKEMPELQAALDELTGNLRDEMNILHNQGTSSFVPNTLTGTKINLTGTDTLTGSGGIKIAVVEKASGNLINEIVLPDLSVYATINDLMTAINIGAGATASLDTNGAFQIQAANSAYGISIGSTTQPAGSFISGSKTLGFSHYFGLNDFFVTDNVTQGITPGIANNLAVRQEIVDDVKRLANTSLDVNAAIGNRVLTPGNGSTFAAMSDAFLQKVNFAASGKIPAVSMSLNEYASTIVQFTVDEGKHLKHIYMGKENLFEISQQSLESIRGVNIQEEMMALMQWQRQQKVCTEVILTAQSMMDDLLRIRR